MFLGVHVRGSCSPLCPYSSSFIIHFVNVFVFAWLNKWFDLIWFDLIRGDVILLCIFGENTDKSGVRVSPSFDLRCTVCLRRIKAIPRLHNEAGSLSVCQMFDKRLTLVEQGSSCKRGISPSDVRAPRKKSWKYQQQVVFPQGMH